MKSILYNPLIIACFIGAFINITNIHIPLVLNNTLLIISSAALPLGLISVGVGLNLNNILNVKNEILISSLAKFIILPLIFYIFATLVNLIL